MFVRAKKYLKPFLRLFAWLFVISLPLTFLPIVGGIWGGVKFSNWYVNHVSETSQSFFEDVNDMINDWGIPGTVSFRTFQEQNNDFHTTRLNNNDWYAKLGFHLPQEFNIGSDVELTEGNNIDAHADLSALMWSPCNDSDTPKEHWVYVTNLAWPQYNEWDAAFDHVVQFSYAHAELGNHEFSFVQCIRGAGFLCGVWLAKVPSLLHFKVDSEAVPASELNPDLTYDGLLASNLHRVVVRAIDFPLEDAYTGLPMHVFPSPKEQMLAIVRGERLYEQFEEFDPTMQVLNRFNEHSKFLRDYARHTWYYRFHKIFDWYWDVLYEPLGLEDFASVTQSLLFTIAIVAVSIVRLPIRLLTELAMSFLGYPSDAERLIHVPEEGSSGNIFDFMMNDFADFLETRFDGPTPDFFESKGSGPSPTVSAESSQSSTETPLQDSHNQEAVPNMDEFRRSLKSVEESLARLRQERA